MKKNLLFLLLFTAAAAMYSQSQLHVFQDWYTPTGTQNFFYKNIVKTDGSGNVYVSGATVNGSGNYDVLVSKFNSSGVLQWTQQYNGAANYQDFATALFVDGSGNVYITGVVTNDTVNQLSDLVIVKYNSGGVQQWIYTYDGAAHLLDAGAALEVDGSGNVYVTGTSYNTSFNSDILAIKVNSSGIQQWVTVYDHTSHLNDAGVKLKSGSTVYVTAVVENTPGAYVMGVLSLSGSTGAITGSVVTGSGSTAMDVVSDMTETGGYIYIAGGTPTVSNGYDYCIIKLDSYLNIDWEVTYDGADHLNDVARGVKVDAGGNVYVTGYSNTSTEGSNYLTQKYNSSGALIWTRTFNDSLNGNDDANALEMNADEEIYITGNVQTAINQQDYYTIKYDTAGTELWSIYFDGDKHLDDKAGNIAIDTTGNVIVTGVSETATGVYEYITVKYVEKQVITPTDFAGESEPSNCLYYENKGQLLNLDGNLIPEVHFYTNSTYPAYYFKNDTMSMVFVRVDTISATNDTIHRIDLSFVNCNEHLKIYPLEKQENYLNYFLAHCPDGITEIHGNRKLIAYELYNNIDLVYSSNQNGIKYYFVVKPGGDPDDIKMRYTGASSTNLSSNILSIRSILDTVIFDRPFTYQLNSSNDTITNSDSYANWHDYTGDKYGIDVHTYDSTKVLIIQIDEGNAPLAVPMISNQSLEWSTYLGGISPSDQAYDVSAAKVNGGVYVCGTTDGASFLGSHTGPVLLPYTTARDAFVAKFDFACVNLWLTFIGGSGQDYATTITNDNSGNVYLGGTTTSPDFSNVSPLGINQSTKQGAQDGFYVEINHNGATILCDSYIGGSGSNDEVRGIALGTPGGTREVYIIGQISGSGCPFVTSGNYNQTTGGSEDGFIMKLNANNANQWCTLVGGNGVDLFTDIALRPSNGNPVIVGITNTGTLTSDICDVPTDTGLPFCDNGGTYYGQNYGGNGDAWIVEFDRTNQSLIWSTPFGGADRDYYSPSLGYGYQTGSDPSITITADDNIYIAGACKGDGTGFPLLNSTNSGNYNQTWLGANVDGFDSYIARFNINRQQTWTSFLGGEHEIVNGICNDGENIFMTAVNWGTITAVPLQSSPDYCTTPITDVFPICNFSNNNYMETTPGGANSAIISFNQNDDIIWSTPFGTGPGQTGKDVYINNNNLYLAGTALFNTTLWDFNPSSTLDYYKPTGGLDGSIARFDISDIVIGIHEEATINNTIYIYPNPSSDYLYIDFDKKSTIKASISIADALGRIIFEEKNKMLEKSVKLDIQHYAKGIYFITISSEQTSYYGKFIKQ